ncbi:hypothetical protein C8F04DRAFT_1406122 [Mycena alexandri]|uniref:Uncharacterized protein n=1 Tax=Mycena alexandri TaxID=1745969 RepID=A0AAD6WLU1_9AGAR|nr:hypothetical protein C8F04DRAFT_1406122 [Mycena alexandri]
MATEFKERERDGKERERRRERDNDDSRSHRSHRSHREREDHDDGPHRSRRDSHRSRDDADKDRRRHHSHSPPRERRHSTSSRAHDTEHEHESHSRESKRHSSSGDHKDDVKAPAYPPDFLRQYSPAGSIGGNDKFDVITGAEAVRFTKQFIRDQAAQGTTLHPALAAALPSTTPPSAPLPLIAKSPSATSHKSLTAHNALESRGSKRLHPVVFALPRSATNAAGGAGRKVVDFYMSWRGKTARAHFAACACLASAARIFERVLGDALFYSSTRRVLIPPTRTPVLPRSLSTLPSFHVLYLGRALAAGRAPYHLFLLLFLGYRPRSTSVLTTPKTHPLKGPSRRANFLDTEFRRVRETLDGEWKRASAGDGCCGRDAAASARGQRPARGQGARTQSIRGEGGDGQCRAQEIGRRGGVPSSAPAGREVIVDTRGGALSRRPRALEAAVRRPSLALPSFFTLHLYLYLSLLTNRTLGVVYGSSPGEAQHRFFSYS